MFFRVSILVIIEKISINSEAEKRKNKHKEKWRRAGIITLPEPNVK